MNWKVDGCSRLMQIVYEEDCNRSIHSLARNMFECFWGQEEFFSLEGRQQSLPSFENHSLECNYVEVVAGVGIYAEGFSIDQEDRDNFEEDIDIVHIEEDIALVAVGMGFGNDFDDRVVEVEEGST